MQILNDVHKKKKLSFLRRWRTKFLRWLLLTDEPVIKIYNGYGNRESIIIMGHLLRFGPLPRKKFRKSIINNSYGLLRLFMVKPQPYALLNLVWEGETYEATTQDDGFFRFELHPKSIVPSGWHPVKVSYHPPGYELPIQAMGEYFIPYPYQYAFISDIDDTFLVSHSSNLKKRLYVLLTKNARSRRPFEGVVNHYQLLASTGASSDTFNLFFYVSSSEWNLYDYIIEFSKVNKLPKGIYLLNQLKRFRQVFKTGQNNHATKFMRITRIIEAYPNQRFILLGDDSQEDPNIYAAVVEHFPQNIYAVCLRHVSKRNPEKVNQAIEKIKKSGVHTCYFTHSSEAVIYCKEIGLIPRD